MSDPSYTNVLPPALTEDMRLALFGILQRMPARNPDLDDGLEYMTDRPMNRNQYAQEYLGEEWKD